MGFEFSGTPELPGVIQIIGYWSSSSAPDSRMVKEFGILSELSMMNISQ
jgi:hypothetical protein